MSNQMYLITVVLILTRFIFCQSKRHYVDMSYTYNNITVYWPDETKGRFKFTDRYASDSDGYHYEANQFSTAEHGGTHLDAPRHFAKGKHGVDEIPIDRLVGLAVVVNVSDEASKNHDLLISEGDFQDYETKHGKIADGVIILLYTGWGKKWPNLNDYLGTDTTNTSLLHFPGLAESGARWILKNLPKVKAIGIDTASIDYGQSKDFISHRVLMAQNVPVFENVANMDKVPKKGATIYALPMKIGDGSGAPLRIIATWDDNPSRSGALWIKPQMTLLGSLFYLVLAGLLQF